MPRREKWLRTEVSFFMSVLNLSLLETVWTQKLCQIYEVVVWVGINLDGFEMECTWTCRLPNTDWFWQNTAGASTLAPKEQMAPQICFKHWISRRCWKSWFFLTVGRSQQQRGKKFVVPSGSTWRRQISGSALQREMVEGWCWRFSCFLWRAFFSAWSCSSLGESSELWSCRMIWSWPRRV